MTAFTWKSGTSGNWGTAGDWTGGKVANSATADVTIAGVGSNVTIASGLSYTVDSVTVGTGSAALTIAGTLDFAGSTDVLLLQTGILDITGTVVGTTIEQTGGTLELSGATLDDVKYDGTLSLAASGSSIYLAGNDTFAGAAGTGEGVINLTGSGAVLYTTDSTTLNNAMLNFGGTSVSDTIYLYPVNSNSDTLTIGPSLSIVQTAKSSIDKIDLYSGPSAGYLTNQGTITASAQGGNFSIYNAGQPSSFTNQGTIAISNGDYLEVADVTTVTNQGDITVTSGGRFDVSTVGTFTNSGTLAATGTGTVVYVGGAWTNSGMLSVSSGAFLGLGGTFAISALSGVSDSGGAIGITGDLINTGGTLSVGTGTTLGTVAFSGAITGGTIADSGGGIVADGGTLNGVIYDGALNLTATSGSLYLGGADSFFGTAGSGAGVINLTGYGANLTADDMFTLNNATVNFGGAGFTDEIYLAGDTDGTLTLGGQLSVTQSASASSVTIDLYSRTGSEGTLINLGTINAGAKGGLFTVYGPSYGVFNNQGSILVSNGDSFDISGVATFTNVHASTLTSGVYEVEAGSTFQLHTGVSITTDSAIIILNGANSVIESLNTSTSKENTLDSQLSSIGSAGTLSLLSGRNFTVAAHSGSFANSGDLNLGGVTFSATALTIATGGTVGGFGTVKAAVTDTGNITANGGTLDVTGSVTGTGGVLIDAASDLTLGTGAASGTSITFGGTSADLSLDAPGSVASTLVSLAPSDVIDLVSLAAASATISGGHLIVSLTAGGTLSYAETSANLLDRVATSSDGHAGTDVSVFGEAQAGTIAPTSLNFGQQHEGAALDENYTVANTAAFGAYSENLDAVFGGVSGNVSASGSFSGLGAGASNSTSLTGTLASTTAGLVSGTGTIDLYTDGTGVPGDGLGTLAIGTQTVTLAGTIFNYATASLATTTASFGDVHTGAAANQFITIDNGAAPGVFSENLDASFAASSTGLSGTGGVSELAAGSASGALELILNSATAGVFAGAATVGLVSDGTGIDTLASTTLAAQTIAASGTVYAYAGPSIASTIISLGNVHVGATDDAALTIANLTANAAYTEGLDASFTGTSGAGTDLGSLLLLGAGNTDSSSLLVGLLDATAGSYVGAATLSLVSDGSLTSGLGTTGLGSDTITVSGAVYALATPTFASTIINLGVIHAGSAGTAALSLADFTSNAAYTESLDAGFIGTSGSITANGTVYLLGAGDTDSSDLVLTLATGTSGTISGSATVGLTSDGSGTSDLGTTSLGDQTVTLTGTVDNYASISLGKISGAGTLTSTLANNYTLYLGSVLEGGAALSANLEVLNSATGLSDLLGGSFTVKTSNVKITNTGIGTFSGLGAGAADTSPVIKLSTGTSGTDTEVLVISSAGSNSSGYSGTLSPVTLTITGIVADVFTITTGVDDFVGAAGNDLFIAGSGDLSAGDVLNGGAGTNTLELLGGGIFDMTQPATLTNISQVTAVEGSGTAAQTVYLRSGYTGTLTAASGGAGSGITVYGNADSATIKLGNGNDTVFVGAKTETISSGTGASVFNVTSATVGAKITAGAGANTLAVSGGGAVTMGTSITGIKDVTINDAGVSGTTFTANTTAKLEITGGVGSDTIVLGAASQAVTAGSGTTLIKGVIADAAASITSNSLGTTTLDLTTGGTGTLNANDTNLTVTLSTTTNLTLSKMGFITVDGSTGNDTMTAMAANQTLTGGLGTDTLTGYAGFGDLFLDTAAGLNGDTIKGFGGSDLVDLTNVNSSLVSSLGWQQVGTGGKLTVSDGSNSATINFSGTYTAASFTFGSDGTLGTYIHFV